MLFRFDLVRAVLNVDITNWMKKFRNYDCFIYKTYICSFYKLMLEIHHNNTILKFYLAQEITKMWSLVVNNYPGASTIFKNI
jgi:hypothetical protein